MCRPDSTVCCLGHEEFAGRSWQIRQSNLKVKLKAPASATPLFAGLCRYLYFSAATTGAAILIIEILGAKMLAPYFGTSHFVWTAQIAVTLVALAIGCYAGGRLVDRSPQLSGLYGAILVAAVYLGLTVLVVERFFNLEPARFNLAIDDGRHFVNRSVQRYDAIILDAFLGDSPPSHLMSREAFAAMRRILKPGVWSWPCGSNKFS